MRESGWDSAVAFTALIGVVVLLRCFELLLSRRHARALLARGGVEAGRPHYRWMVALHTLFFVSMLAELWILRPAFDPRWGVVFGTVFFLGNVLRWWAIRTLGPLWCTRVIRVPGDPLVRSGPYRWLRHPNYVGVALEIFSLPLIHGLWRSALVFTLLDLWVLRARLRYEEAVLTEGPFPR